jgi:hypothetical protein
MTVPPLFGWDDVLLVLALVVLAAVVAFAALAAGRARSGRSEFRAWLDGRSSSSTGDRDASNRRSAESRDQRLR